MLEFIVVPFINIMIWIYDLLGQNFGLTIIVFTVLIRLALYPFTKRQMDSAKAMQDMQSDPEWLKIQKKYKDDREKLAQEQMRVYQERGINPLGSCLPTLLQLPIIFALYWAITRSLAATPIQLLDLARDVTLPNFASLVPLNSTFLWMDLSQPERLRLDIFADSIPFLATHGIPVLAILVMITSYLQTQMTTATTTDPSNPQAAGMTKAMSLYMPLFIGWISYSYAAGLALYFFMGNIASIIQYALMGRMDLSNIFPKRNSDT